MVDRIDVQKNVANAILFKADDTESTNDPYLSELEKISLNTTLISALKFEYYNLEELQSNLSSPEKFSGIIFNSPRCVSAVEKCGSVSKWFDHKIFAVGPKTASLARQLGFDPIGEDSDTSEALVKFILKDFSDLKLPLLIPHGDLSLKSLTNILTDNNIKVKSLEVYHTLTNPDLEFLIQEWYKSNQRVDFVIFRSPSAVNACLPFLQSNQDLSTIKFVTLGPTTASALEANSIAPAGVAKKPTPQHLADLLSDIISNLA